MDARPEEIEISYGDCATVTAKKISKLLYAILRNYSLYTSAQRAKIGGIDAKCLSYLQDIRISVERFYKFLTCLPVEKENESVEVKKIPNGIETMIKSEVTCFNEEEKAILKKILQPYFQQMHSHLAQKVLPSNKEDDSISVQKLPSLVLPEGIVFPEQVMFIDTYLESEIPTELVDWYSLKPGILVVQKEENINRTLNENINENENEEQLLKNGNSKWNYNLSVVQSATFDFSTIDSTVLNNERITEIAQSLKSYCKLLPNNVTTTVENADKRYLDAIVNAKLVMDQTESDQEKEKKIIDFINSEYVPKLYPIMEAIRSPEDQLNDFLTSAGTHVDIDSNSLFSTYGATKTQKRKHTKHYFDNNLANLQEDDKRNYFYTNPNKVPMPIHFCTFDCAHSHDCGISCVFSTSRKLSFSLMQKPGISINSIVESINSKDVDKAAISKEDINIADSTTTESLGSVSSTALSTAQLPLKTDGNNMNPSFASNVEPVSTATGGTSIITTTTDKTQKKKKPSAKTLSEKQLTDMNELIFVNSILDCDDLNVCNVVIKGSNIKDDVTFPLHLKKQAELIKLKKTFEEEVLMEEFQWRNILDPYFVVNTVSVYLNNHETAALPLFPHTIIRAKENEDYLYNFETLFNTGEDNEENKVYKYDTPQIANITNRETEDVLIDEFTAYNEIGTELDSIISPFLTRGFRFGRVLKKNKISDQSLMPLLDPIQDGLCYSFKLKSRVLVVYPYFSSNKKVKNIFIGNDNKVNDDKNDIWKSTQVFVFKARIIGLATKENRYHYTVLFYDISETKLIGVPVQIYAKFICPDF